MKRNTKGKNNLFTFYKCYLQISALKVIRYCKKNQITLLYGAAYVTYIPYMLVQ